MGIIDNFFYYSIFARLGGPGLKSKLQLIVTIFALTACSTPAQIAGGIVGTTVVGARAPGTEIEQIYYLGSFDPQGQLKPEMYRIRVHGQASAISGVNFGSGWAPAQLVDSLSTTYRFDQDDSFASSNGTGLATPLAVGRAQMLFGPEGFREAPRDHRLVIVMGSSPEAFFQAIDETLGAVAAVQQKQRQTGVEKELFTALSTLIADRKSLERLNNQLKEDGERLAGQEPPNPQPAPNNEDKSDEEDTSIETNDGELQ